VLSAETHKRQILEVSPLRITSQEATIASLDAKLANDKDYLATRVAYKFNLKGPAFTIQTACSTSLVAVCQACQNLLMY